MKVVSKKNIVNYGELQVGEVFKIENLSEEDNYYLKTDLDFIVDVQTGFTFIASDIGLSKTTPVRVIKCSLVIK